MSLIYKRDLLLIKRFIRNELIIKDFYYKSLNPCQLASANARLSFFSNSSSSLIPKFQWSVSQNKIQVVSERIFIGNLEGREVFKKLLNFSKELGNTVSVTYPHGDINTKNIAYDGMKLRLLDIEPILEINSNTVSTYFRSTKPYIHPFDIENRKISYNSDLLGFCCYSCKALGVNLPRSDIVKYCTKIFLYPQKFSHTSFTVCLEMLIEKFIGNQLNHFNY
jgi:hypothetical protein